MCETDEQCSRASEGRCEDNGACSYPTDTCASGRRYSGYGQREAGACVPLPTEGTSSSTSSTTAEATTTLDPASTGDRSESSGDEGSTGTPSDCAETCSGHGQCVLLEGEPTCACDPGWWMVGLECLEDPCDQVQCYFVDAATGDDEAAGTRDAPWQSQDRAWEHLDDASPGDHVLFRRGGEYPRSSPENSRTLRGSGTALDPIVVGAYGPPQEDRPRLLAASYSLSDVEHVVFRDLDLQGTGQSVCFALNDAGFITTHDNEISDCGNRGFRISDGSHHVVVFRNDIHDVGNKTAVWIADIDWEMPVRPVGSHHWVAANTIRNNGERGIDVDIDASYHEPGDGDAKVIGNQVQGSEDNGIRLRGGTGWLLGNVSAENVAENEAGISAGGDHVWVEGNVVVLSGQGFNLNDRATVLRNTVFLDGDSPALRIEGGLVDGHVADNLLFDAQGTRVTHVSDSPNFATLDGNVYALTDSTECVFNVNQEAMDLAQWRVFTGLAQTSRCEVVPGLERPGVSVPVGDAFWTALSPDAEWEGCGTVGAVGCDGVQVMPPIEPLPEVDDNGGLGWEGPLLIRQHYSL